MGKKARKTRWRALTLADELSDSETSSTTTAPRLPNGFQTQKNLSNRYTYSSQSTPRRRYQYDSTKSTRSSSTASENKMSFNEGDYTKISTPRQDVLFKKGYLNKPRNYHPQTSTGTSTNSTGNSTGNGTPDYQSTDFEYESQFVFPNGFVDHNGYCYVNGYDYPFMIYNFPTYYQDYSNYESKRHSSSSLTESMSPHNEEATSQDLSGGEASNSHSDTGSSHHHHHSHSDNSNVVNTNHYQNGIPSSHNVVNGEFPADQTRKIKKRRRRRTSQSAKQDSTENSDDELNHEDKPKNIVDTNENVLAEKPNDLAQEQCEKIPSIVCENVENERENIKEEVKENDNTSDTKDVLSLTSDSNCPITDELCSEKQSNDLTDPKIVETDEKATVNQEISETPKQTDNTSSEPSKDINKPEEVPDNHTSQNDDKTTEHVEIVTQLQTNTDASSNTEAELASQDQQSQAPKYDLKPDAKEFVPRAYRTPDIPLSPVQFINIPGNFVPLQIFPFNGQNFNPAFLPPGIPINFIRPDPKMFPNFMGFPQGGPPCNGQEAAYNEEHQQSQTHTSDESSDNSNTANDEEPQKPEPDTKEKPKSSNKTIDIATVVSKLEVAAKEQEKQQSNAMSKTTAEETVNNQTNTYQRHHRFKNNANYKGNYYNRSQNSPQRELRYRNKEGNLRQNGETSHFHLQKPPQTVEPNHGIKQNYSQVSHSNSPPRMNGDATKSSPFRQNLQTARNTQSPLRQNGDVHRGSPYKQPGPGSIESSDVKNIPANLPRKSADKTKQAWKQPYFKNNKWKHQNNTTYDNRSKNVDNGAKDEPNYKHYSDTSRLISNRRFNEDNVIKETKNFIKTEAAKAKYLPQETPTGIPPSPNQWISVQKRKKRKNKNAEEVDNFPDDEVDDDQFESYDVNQLIDVVVTEKNETNNLENQNNVTEESKDSQSVEEVLTVVVETEAIAEEKPVIINEVKESEEVVKEAKVQEELEAAALDEVPENSGIPADNEDSEIVVAKDKKKKSKKNPQKPLKRKVIVKNIDLSDQFVENKEPVAKVVVKVKKSPEPVPSTSQESPPKEEVQQEETSNEDKETFNKEQSPESVKSNEQDEKKKSKKKKKKASKTVNGSTASNPDCTLGSADDTFDFLDSVLTNETEDKTNDEISQELDKIIQKGMLNSIEEKIKSLNIDESDGFFKSVWTKLSRKETSMGYTKIPVFAEILKPSAKPHSVSREVDLQNTKCYEILSPADSVEPTTEGGLFLDNPGLVDVLEDTRKPTAAPDDEKIDTKKNVHDGEVAIARHDIEIGEIEQPHTLYPITKAVKEWMCRTRETTPDVELLKSPTEIFEEFCDISDSDTDTEIDENQMTKFSKELTPSGDVTATREQSIEQQDLLECWDDDVEYDKSDDGILKNTPDDVKTVDDDDNDDDDEELPVYESKYGKNEDFLTIQKKIRERNGQLDRSSPTQTTLPQRAAVCCNIM